jgi:hypothetical protein
LYRQAAGAFANALPRAVGGTGRLSAGRRPFAQCYTARMMIRLLSPADAPAYVALRRQMLVDTPWAFASSPDNDRGSDAAGVAASMAGPGYAIGGAFDEPCGALGAGGLASVAVLMRETNPKRAHLAWIVSVYTHPAARRHGLSRRVLTRLIELARTWPGVAALALSVSENAPEAQALYRSLGFAAWGCEPDALRVGHQSYAEIHMRLSL